MTRRDQEVPARTLVALVAAGVFLFGCAPPEAPFTMHADGIGPLQLGRGYEATVAAARATAPETAFAGLGCNGLDEVRYSGELDGLPVSAMGMAVEGVIVEIEVSLDSPLQAPGEDACVALRDDFAAPFIRHYGSLEAGRTERKPVSREHLADTGPVVVVARWFPTGNSCYVSAHYGLGASLGAPAAW